MSGLNGVNAELRERVEAVIREGGGRLWVSAGFRSRQEQERLYKLFLAGKGSPANKPGTSLHEVGLAVDVACAAVDNKVRAALFARWGLKTPYVVKEPWHVELAPDRKPLPPKEDKVKPMFNPPYSLEPIVADLKCPTGGAWLLAISGAVYAFGGAPFLGGANGKDYFIGRKAARLELNDRKGYDIIATSGERYSYP